MKFNWLMALPLIIALGLFGVYAYKLKTTEQQQSEGVDTSSLPSTREGHPAPDLDLSPLANFEDLSRADLEGNGLIIVNFWASWCPPCRAEHPTLAALAEAGNPLFGINYRDRPADALQYLGDLGNPYDRLSADPEARNGRDWGVIAMPETFFINDEGVVVLHFRGPIVRRSLLNQVVPALQEAGYSLNLPTDMVDG